MGRKLRVVGCDPSLRNWGLAIGTYDMGTKKIEIERLSLICPTLPKGKQVRQNSLDLESAVQHTQGTVAAAVGAHAIFVEVPVGSQTARAMASYGICVGVLGALRAGGIQFFEVTPTEVKVATGNKKTASKTQMIEWAMRQHPEANWPTYKRCGEALLSEAQAEHMADAVATIYAGVNSNSFQQLLPILAAQP